MQLRTGFRRFAEVNHWGQYEDSTNLVGIDEDVVPCARLDDRALWFGRHRVECLRAKAGGTLPMTTTSTAYHGSSTSGTTTAPRQTKRSVSVHLWSLVCVAPPARQLVYPTPSPGQLLRRQTVIPEHLCPSAAGPVPAVLLVATPLPSIPPQHVYPSPVARRTHGSTPSHTVRGELPLRHGRRHRPQTRRSTRAESSENWSNTCPGSSSTS